MDASGELLFTILSSLAQEESRNISENCTWGIRHGFQRGILRINTTMFMGYDKDEEGNLIINKEQAKVVRRVFREFEEGWTLSEIAKHLKEDKIKGVKGKCTWTGVSILEMLTNEKYMGDALLQKTYTVDFLTKKRVRNKGEIQQYYVKNSHKGIIPKEEWQAVQMELERRKEYCKEVGLKRYGNVSVDSPFTSKLVCGQCGAVYCRQLWRNRNVNSWFCRKKLKHNGATCRADNVKNEILRKLMVTAWNAVVKERDSLTGSWEKMKESGDPLEALRARQMIQLTAQGPLVNEVPELTRMVLERIVIHDKRHFTVRFLDGTIKEVCITE